MIPGPVDVLLESSCPRIYEEVVRKDCYGLAHLSSLMTASPPRVIYDLGAQVGCFSALAASTWPQADIYAVEPHGPHFHCLCEIANCLLNIHPIRAAIGTRPVSIVANDGVDPALTYWETAAPPASVPTLTLAQLAKSLEPKTPYLVKIDIEGAEVCFFDDTESSDILRSAVWWTAELHNFNPAGPWRTSCDSPSRHYVAQRKVIQDTVQWIHGFTDCQAVVLNMGLQSWIVQCRSIHNAPWSPLPKQET